MGLASRREAEALIKEGSVTLNGKIAQLGDQAIPGEDHVKVNGKLIKWDKAPRKVVIALFKPRGILADRPVDQVIDRGTVYDMLSKVKEKVQPVGSLDSDNEGLMLLTNHGDLAARLTRSKYEIERKFSLKVDGHLIEKKLRRLGFGIKIENKKVSIQNIKITRKLEGKEWIVATTTQPQNRMIRKLFESVGHPVDKVRFETFGPITLKGLKRGEWRFLDSKEIEDLEKLVGLKKAPREEIEALKRPAPPKIKKKKPPQRGKRS